MSVLFRLALVVTAVAVAAAPAHAQDRWDKYLDEKCQTIKIAPAAKDLIGELRLEIQKIFDAGPLAPHRCVFADTLDDMYFVYWQPGRIITTLAAAYPHLSPEQQQAVVTYVRAELASAERAPWCARGHLPPSQGARRELHAFNESLGWDRYWGMWGRNRPTLGGFYGLWLYADRTGDWDTVKKHYEAIATFYRAKAGQGDLYGTMGSHVAMARIAHAQNDAAITQLARANAATAFELGKSFEEIEKRTQKYYKDRYEKRQIRGTYLGWMFLDFSPEVGRYLGENVKEAVLKRHDEGLRRYPLFWLREAPYNSRWTGDEGLGVPTELMGMIVPIERWVAGAEQKKLVGYTRSTPICIGDCHWIEMLVDAIESFGTTQWVKAN